MVPLLLAIIPGLWHILEDAFGALTNVAKSGLMGGLSGLESLSASGILEVAESLLGKLADDKRAVIQAQIEDLLAQANIVEAEIQSPKPFWMIPHELAEFSSVAYLIGCTAPRLALQLTAPFGLSFTLAPIDNTLIYICVGVLGLIRTYKALTD